MTNSKPEGDDGIFANGLDHYLAVRDGRRAPRFVESRLAGLLDRKIQMADRMLDACDLCPHHCLVNRNAGERGFCGVTDRTAVHWEGVLHGEEIELGASHEVFFSGCTMRCAFCFAHAHITRPMSGLPMAPEELANCVDKRRAQGASNVNLVGGEPIVHLANILKMLRDVTRPSPVVWNSNLYATEDTMALLEGVVDLYLGDIHFGNEECAAKLGRIPDYLPSVHAAFQTAARSGASVIIRHLVMPGHLECCARPAMEWAARELPDTPFHLMFQYLPEFRTLGDPVMGRALSLPEIARAEELAREIGVRRYQEAEFASPPMPETEGGVGETVDILIHEDGRVSFTRLTGDLLPVAAALNAGDERVSMRMGRS
ncbi:hypothetical protein CCAX7_37480 [Capsulimonas corticalis]|uniref:Uncharacterized protein n=1 Tax=Capsulimonas corticalis TaxID=2219043 RepID=A0A402D154_9BACT|nr:radical SAM protein [Capsulimonas corticalis]BDI31697.1 hypothetical protein CCAX7_37480 [Capsulimonas corticalis]